MVSILNSCSNFGNKQQYLDTGKGFRVKKEKIVKERSHWGFHSKIPLRSKSLHVTF